MRRFFKLLTLFMAVVAFIFLFQTQLMLWVAKGADRYDYPPLAIYLYEKVLVQAPESYVARQNLAALYFDTGMGEKAVALLDLPPETAGNFYKLYLSGCLYYTEQGEIQKALDLLAHIKDSYGGRKISDNRPTPPVFMPAPGEYDRNLRVIPLGKLGERCYIRLGEGPFQLATQAMALPDGNSIVTAVAVNHKGIVSEVATGVYRLAPQSVFAQKALYDYLGEPPLEEEAPLQN